ncbi:Histidine phosphatase family protein [Sulfidibacter corallicola]|uniref:Histidine phosphatase family protein n=1 Tax=Sulfidibacter corallicola TaxID=2818388 RepID=A0A8A4TRN1_SULCO|nr:histidine phosphatase family protein [Sulfidibacter corallicola]QTD52616.1 histidine phosphatase family protein [Sulfidibacter corallicola]
MKELSLTLRLLLIRHGQAEGNRQGVFMGHRDDPLTEQGRAQALRLADRLCAHGVERVDRWYSSPLRRASNTAEIVASAMGATVHLEERLKEQDFGDWDGLTLPELMARFPSDYRAWRRDGSTQPPTGGESLESVGERVWSFYRELRTMRPEGETIALVGHAGNLQALLCRLFQIPLRSIWPFRLQNGSLTQIDVVEELPVLTHLSVI